jgi:hypothetical protein
MKKFFYPYYLLLAAFLYSCNYVENLTPQEGINSTQKNNLLSAKNLSQDAYFKILVNNRTDLNKKIENFLRTKNSAELENLKSILANMPSHTPPAAYFELVGISKQEFEIIDSEYKAAMQGLVTKYPDITKKVSNVTDFFKEAFVISGYSNTTSSRLDCDSQYASCVAVAASNYLPADQFGFNTSLAGCNISYGVCGIINAIEEILGN